MDAARPVERRIVTVLFADLVGFTALSERLDAEDVALVQDAYFEVVRESIHRHGGQLEKFVGDAAMAVFGAPQVRDDDAARAVAAALALVAGVERLGDSLGLPGELRLRVGVNSGEAVYGEATAERGPVTGDTVNVAARLQAAAEPGTVVVGELTALATADVVELAPLEPLALKGKAAPVRARRALSVYPEPSRERALGSLRAPLVGRAVELAFLRGSAAGLVLVVAPPGVGKSRLLAELAEGRAAQGARVLTARLRPDSLAPFEPVAQLVRSAAPGGDVDRLLAAAGLAPGRAAAVAETLEAVLHPSAAERASEERERLFRDWLDGLEALAHPRDALWLVEDVHWASPDLLAFLAFAGRAGGPVVACSARPSLLDAQPAWCEAARLLELAPLPAPDAGALVRALVGSALPDPLVARIAEASGGNPLFVEELLRTWVSVGILAANGGGWRLAATAEEVALPQTVQAIYAGQLDDLPAAARDAARRASVAGRRFPTASFAALGVEDGERGLTTLARRAFVDGPVADPALGASYVFRHALLRDAGYASLSRGDRSTLHAHFADWLAARPEEALPSLAEVVARHYAAALEHAPQLVPAIASRTRDEVAALAAGWFERAARAASDLAAWASAAALAESSVELTAAGAQLERARRLHVQGRAAANADGVDRALPLLREALALFREAGDRVGVAEAGAEIGRLLRAQTRFAAAAELADELLQELGESDDVARARLLVLRGGALLNAIDAFEPAESDGRRALEIAGAAGDPDVELDALTLVLQARVERTGDVAEADWEEVERLACARRRWDAAATAILSRAWRAEDEDVERALAVLDEAAELATARGLVERLGWCDYGRAEALFAAGRWDEAVDAGLRALGRAAEHDFHRVAVRTWFVLLPIGRARGDRTLAAQAFELFRARAGREPNSPYANVITVSAHLHLAAAGLEPEFVPDLDGRLRGLDLDHRGPSWNAAIVNLVRTWVAAGDLAAAGAALDRMRAALERTDSGPLAAGTEALLRAELLLAAGGGADAEARRALALLPRQARWWRASAIRALEQRGGADGALVREAAETRARPPARVACNGRPRAARPFCRYA